LADDVSAADELSFGTLLGVAVLGYDGQLVELDLTAALPATPDEPSRITFSVLAGAGYWVLFRIVGR
jgi:hypothetical protein